MKINFKTALITSVIILVSVSLIIANYLAYSTLKNEVVASTKESVTGDVETQALLLEDLMSDQAAALDDLTQYLKTDEVSNQTLFTYVGQAGMGVGDFTIGYEDGSYYGTWVDLNDTSSSYDPRVRPWYILAKKYNRVVFTDVYPDSTTGKQVVSIGRDFGRGVAIADIPLDMLEETAEAAGKSGTYGVVITDKGVVLASTASSISKGENMNDSPALGELFSKLKDKERALIEYEIDGDKRRAISVQVSLGDSGKSWYIVSGVSEELMYQKARDAAKASFTSTLIMVAIAALIMFIILNKLYTPVIALRDMLATMSKGEADLTQRLEVVNENDDLGKITTHINDWIADNQQMMIQIKSVSDELGKVVGDVRENSSSNIAILSEHVGQTEQVVTAIEEMNVTARSVAESASQAAEVTQSADKTGEESRMIVAEAQQSVLALVDEVQNAASGVQTMSNETENISSITGVIGGIAEQTNLLALNAAIEAARAGDQGRGFAVVADEVRALAARTQGSTTEIDDAVNSLTSSSGVIVRAMDETKTSCERSAEQTSIVSESLGALSDAISEINSITEQIATAAEEQTSVTEEISKNITEISSMANTVNSNVQRTAENVDTMAAMYEQLNAIVGNSKIQ